MHRYWKSGFWIVLFWIGVGNVQAQTDPDSLVEPDTAAVIVDTIADVPDLEPEVTPAVDPELVEESEFLEDGIHRFSLRSPYHTILSHLYFLQPDSYFPDSAAMTLYVKEPGSEGARRDAIMLKQYMDGAGYFIDLDDLPQAPNFVDTLTGKHKFHPIPEVPSIFVYKKGKRWLYSYTTVEAIAELHKSIYPLGTLEWLPDWAHRRFLGFQLWQFIAIVLFMIVGFLLHKLLTMLLGTVLQRFLKRFVKKDTAADFFDRIARPISLLVLFYVLWAIVPALQLPIGLNKWIILAFRVMIPIFYMFLFLQLVNVAMAYFERRAAKTESTLDDQLIPLLRNLFKAILVIFFIIIILNQLKVDITALVGGVAFGSLALALAAQDTVKNLFGSFLIFVDRPFQMGDWVIIEGHEGVVEEVSVRSTRIRTFAGSIISIPNGNIASTAINNMGVRAFRRFTTKVGVTYDTPPHVVETFVAGVREIVRNHPTTRKDAFEVAFNEMGDSALLILIYCFFEVPTWSDELEGRQNLLLAIMRLAEELGVSFAFPTQTLHMETFPEKKALTVPFPHSEAEYRAKMEAYTERYKLRAAEEARAAASRNRDQIRGADAEG